MNPAEIGMGAAPAPPTLLQRACLGLLRLLGWTAVPAVLPEPKGVIIVYPHTSNWDFVIGLLYRFGTGLRASWVGKDSLFRWPVRGLLLRMGGVPVDRRAANGFIGAAIARSRDSDWMWLAIAPEGTRARQDHLKSGFYQIALGADVPCGLGFIDYRTRTVGITRFVRFSGDAAEDIRALRDFYAGKQGRVPAGASEIRFRR